MKIHHFSFLLVLGLVTLTYGVENFTESFDDPDTFGFTVEKGIPVFSDPQATVTFSYEGQIYREFGPGSFINNIKMSSVTMAADTSNSVYYRIYDGSDVLLFQARKVPAGVQVLYGIKIDGVTNYEFTETIAFLSSLELQVVWNESVKTYTLSAAYNDLPIEQKTVLQAGQASPTINRSERIFLGGINTSYPSQPMMTLDNYSMVSLEASNPEPSDGGELTGSAPELTWQQGGFVKAHHVFLGTDKLAVENSIPLEGDVNGDGVVNFQDYASLANQWLQSDILIAPTPDLNHDSIVDLLDLQIVALNWFLSGDGIFKGCCPAGVETYTPKALSPDTIYYWRVDEVTPFGDIITGDLWRLKTASGTVSNPKPVDGRNPVDINAQLVWSPAFSATSYDVYFGTDSTPDETEFRGNQSGTIFIPGVLSTNTTYYWRVDTVCADDTYVGHVWSFTTVKKVPGTENLIHLLPNEPTSYDMRDWHAVAQEYNSLVSDFNATGEYLPLVWWDTERVNYDIDCPFIPSFVGINKGGDALNLFGTVIGATLVGVDKSDEDGYDWVRSMMQFQGTSVGREIIGNNKDSQKSTGIWYDIVPGIYFSQAVELYPDIALIQTPYSFQSGSASMEDVMYSTANKWYEVLDFLGGSETGIADFTGVVEFNTVTMEADDRDGTHPGVLESAAGLAWIEYIAYRKFGENRFLTGTEWALNYLDTVDRNPMHNGVQMGYGALTMARLNAELDYNYDVDQMFRWIFGEGEPLRTGWGVIYGDYGGYEVSGLIGTEGQRGGDNRAYAKQGYHLVASLVPMVRYDQRYAHAVGKWVLHTASSSRHYYQTYVADDNRDSPFWAGDQNGVIPFESLRGYQDVSYFEDYLAKLQASSASNPAVITKVISAISNPPEMWGSGYAGTTNGGIGLCLYFGGDVGFLGGIIRSTNIEKILQLDMLITDFYRDDAYPTYLYYNPYDTSQSIEINVGADPVDIYDTVTHTFIANSVTDIHSFTIPADSARVLVLAPENGTISYSGRKMMINGVIVDYYYMVNTTLFSDDFESGSLDLGGWSSQNTFAEVKTEAAYNGTYGVKLYKTTWIEKAVSTAGCHGIYVKYRRSTIGYDTGDSLIIEWYDGNNWQTLESVQVAEFSDGLQCKSCGSSADDNPNFLIRFRGTATESDEYAYIDDIEVLASD